MYDSLAVWENIVVVNCCDYNSFICTGGVKLLLKKTKQNKQGSGEQAFDYLTSFRLKADLESDANILLLAIS